MIVPSAKKKLTVHIKHGHHREDYYQWMNDREDAEVIAHLTAENDYTDAIMKDTRDLQDHLVREMRSRIKEDDQSVPFIYKDYQYYIRYEHNKEYPLVCRKGLADVDAETILLDGNALAEGHSFFQLGSWSVSPDQKMLAFSVDTVGRRQYTMQIRDLITGEVMGDAVHNMVGEIIWANDNRTLFYSLRDQTLRPYRIMRHILGHDELKDDIVFEETDPTFATYIGKTGSEKYLFISSHSTMTDEYRYLNADKPEGTFTVFHPRTTGLEYSLDHVEGKFLILTNHEAQNFRLMESDEFPSPPDQWVEIIAHREDTLLEGVEVFKDFVVVSERMNGLMNFRVMDLVEHTQHLIRFEEEDYHAWSDVNTHWRAQTFRYGTTSLKTPVTIMDYHMKDRTAVIRKQQPVLGGYDPHDYETRRVYATARDGVQVPVSLIWKKDMRREEGNPTLLYGYGSYGISIDSVFRSNRLSLIDRGFVYAVAHIRGGEELGRDWYEQGKLNRKWNTFHDFVDVTRFLISQKVALSKHVYAYGGSAGGLLMGVVVNEQPELYNGIIAAVPFVDVVTTMLDDTIPLTTGEYDEWGNPNEPEDYHYMLSYSPYDQVKEAVYPAMLVTTGLHDSQVQYWEPAKWVAKLRDHNRGEHPVLLYTNMDAGHGGASGRFEVLKETALEYAFLLKLEGKTSI